MELRERKKEKRKNNCPRWMNQEWVSEWMKERLKKETVLGCRYLVLFYLATDSISAAAVADGVHKTGESKLKKSSKTLQLSWTKQNRKSEWINGCMQKSEPACLVSLNRPLFARSLVHFELTFYFSFFFFLQLISGKRVVLQIDCSNIFNH